MKQLFMIFVWAVGLVFDSQSQLQVDSIQLRLRPLDSRKPSTDIMVSTFGEIVAIKYNHKDLKKLMRIVKSLPKCSEDISDESRPYFSIQIFYSNG